MKIFQEITNVMNDDPILQIWHKLIKDFQDISEMY